MSGGDPFARLLACKSCSEGRGREEGRRLAVNGCNRGIRKQCARIIGLTGKIINFNLYKIKSFNLYPVIAQKSAKKQKIVIASDY